MDEQRLKDERRSRQQMQDKMSNVGDYMNDMMLVGRTSRGVEDHATYQHPGYVDEDQDLKKAIEESKRMAEQEFRSRGEGFVPLCVCVCISMGHSYIFIVRTLIYKER